MKTFVVEMSYLHIEIVAMYKLNITLVLCIR